MVLPQTPPKSPKAHILHNSRTITLFNVKPAVGFTLNQVISPSQKHARPVESTGRAITHSFRMFLYLVRIPVTVVSVSRSATGALRAMHLPYQGLRGCRMSGVTVMVIDVTQMPCP